MITSKVIDEIYKNFKKPPKHKSQLQLEHYIEQLAPHHLLSLSEDGEEIIIGDLDDFNPFKRFLVNRLTGIVEFDKTVAFAFDNHIIFLDKDTNEMRVHFKSEKRSLLSRLFRRK